MPKGISLQHFSPRWFFLLLSVFILTACAGRTTVVNSEVAPGLYGVELKKILVVSDLGQVVEKNLYAAIRLQLTSEFERRGSSVKWIDMPPPESIQARPDLNKEVADNQVDHLFSVRKGRGVVDEYGGVVSFEIVTTLHDTATKKKIYGARFDVDMRGELELDRHNKRAGRIVSSIVDDLVNQGLIESDSRPAIKVTSPPSAGVGGSIVAPNVAAIATEIRPFSDGRPTKIAILPVMEPKKYSAENQSPVGGLNLITFFASGAPARQATSDLTQRARDRKFEISKQLEAALSSELSQAGISHVALDSPRIPLEDSDGYDYTEIKADAEAVLHLYFSDVGAVSRSLSSTYEPRISVYIALVRPSDGEWHTYGWWTFGYGTKETTEQEIVADSKYQWSNAEDLVRRSDLLFESLDVGIKAIAKSIVSHIRTVPPIVPPAS